MFTPQEIQEKTFVKAVFGGYDMQTVDEFLEPLAEDYITLYKENAVLKSKMKVLVEKLEEYRSQEQSMRKAILSAQRTADAMVAEAERKSASIVNEAAQTAQAKASEVVEAEEEERINNAKLTARSFIEQIEQDIKGHLALLEKLKERDLSVTEPKPAARKKPYNFEEEEGTPIVVKTEPARESAEEIANEIEQNITRMMDIGEPESVTEEKPSVTSNTVKFSNLQFGNNYDPTNG